MNTKNSTAEEAATHLLKTLDRMQADGVSPQVRLAHLQEHNPLSQVENSLDIDLDSLLSRIRHFERLANSIQDLSKEWASTPFDSSPKNAGLGLLGHLERLVEEQRDAHGRDEIDFLSRMWESGPDLRQIYPWLNPGVPLGRVVASSLSIEDFRIAIMRQRLADGVEANPADIDEEKFSDSESNQPGQSPEADAVQEISPEIPAQKLHVEGSEVRLSNPPFERNLTKESRDADPERIVARVGGVSLSALPEPDALITKAWTEALNEETATNWSFTALNSQGPRIGMQWSLPEHDNSDARLEIQSLPSGEVQVMLRVIDRKGRIERASTKMSLAELDSLYANPAPFVKTLVEG